MDAILYELNLIRLTLEIMTVVLAAGFGTLLILGVVYLVRE